MSNFFAVLVAAAGFTAYLAYRTRSLLPTPQISDANGIRPTRPGCHLCLANGGDGESAAVNLDAAVEYHRSGETTTSIYPKLIRFGSIMTSEKVWLPDVDVNARYDTVYMRYQDIIGRKFCSVTKKDETRKQDVSVCDKIMQPLQSYVTPIELHMRAIQEQQQQQQRRWQQEKATRC